MIIVLSVIISLLIFASIYFSIKHTFEYGEPFVSLRREAEKIRSEFHEVTQSSGWTKEETLKVIEEFNKMAKTLGIEKF